MKFSIFALSFVILLSGWEVRAEPWLSNRFARNCAACHAPGRINRKPKDRRCTLSCQGCHVNPNGGGMRNYYGIWNSARFVRSFHSKITWNERLPAPFKKQKYAKKKIKKKQKRLYAARGARLVERKGLKYTEKEYEDHINYKRTAKNIIQDLMFISENDPYRLERTTPVYATGDLRLFFLRLDGENLSEERKEAVFWPMALDVGLRVRPLRNHRLSLVYELRAFNTSRKSSTDFLFGAGPGGVQTRSAYALYDDMPYNSYIQYGFYRPMFGIYNPNHENLFADYSGLDQNAVFKGLGLGMAPNVPFFMFNLLRRSENPQTATTAQEEGFVVTGGLRGVTLGLSLVGSYWSTRTTSAGSEARKLMINVNGGMTVGRFVLNGDFTRIDRTAINGQRDAVTLITAETKYRFWREMYLQLNYTTANAALDPNATNGLGKGSGSELAFGAKAFLIAGTELEFLMQQKTNTLETAAEDTYNIMSLQFHLYF